MLGEIEHLMRTPDNVDVDEEQMIRGMAAGVAAFVSDLASLAREAGVQQAATNRDPIFAAIEAHRAAERRHKEAVAEADKIEGASMKATPGDYREGIAAEEADPDWQKADAELAAASDATERLAHKLIDTEPTTLAGVIAVLEYVDEYNDWSGRTFPDGFVGSGGHSRPFEAFLSTTLASALRRIGNLPAAV